MTSQVGTLFFNDFQDMLVQVVNGGIVVVRVVAEGEQVLDAGFNGGQYRIDVAGMAPTPFALVVFLSVLGVMDKDIGIAHELDNPVTVFIFHVFQQGLFFFVKFIAA